MENGLASLFPSTEPHRPFVNRYFEELLARGIQYFLPSSELAIAGRSEAGKPELHSHFRGGAADLEYLGVKYSLVNQGKDFTEHEQKLLKGIGKVLSTRYQLLFNAEVVALAQEIFNGLPEDHYVSGISRSVCFCRCSDASQGHRSCNGGDRCAANQCAEHVAEDRRIDWRAWLF